MDFGKNIRDVDEAFDDEGNEKKEKIEVLNWVSKKFLRLQKKIIAGDLSGQIDNGSKKLSDIDTASEAIDVYDKLGQLGLGNNVNVKTFLIQVIMKENGDLITGKPDGSWGTGMSNNWKAYRKKHKLQALAFNYPSNIDMYYQAVKNPKITQKKFAKHITEIKKESASKYQEFKETVKKFLNGFSPSTALSKLQKLGDWQKNTDLIKKAFGQNSYKSGGLKIYPGNVQVTKDAITLTPSVSGTGVDKIILSKNGNSVSAVVKKGDNTEISGFTGNIELGAINKFGSASSDGAAETSDQQNSTTDGSEGRSVDKKKKQLALVNEALVSKTRESTDLRSKITELKSSLNNKNKLIDSNNAALNELNALLSKATVLYFDAGRDDPTFPEIEKVKVPDDLSTLGDARNVLVSKRKENTDLKAQVKEMEELTIIKSQIIERKNKELVKLKKQLADSPVETADTSPSESSAKSATAPVQAAAAESVESAEPAAVEPAKVEPVEGPNRLTLESIKNFAETMIKDEVSLEGVKLKGPDDDGDYVLENFLPLKEPHDEIDIYLHHDGTFEVLNAEIGQPLSWSRDQKKFVEEGDADLTQEQLKTALLEIKKQNKDAVTTLTETAKKPKTDAIAALTDNGFGTPTAIEDSHTGDIDITAKYSTNAEISAQITISKKAEDDKKYSVIILKGTTVTPTLNIPLTQLQTILKKVNEENSSEEITFGDFSDTSQSFEDGKIPENVDVSVETIKDNEDEGLPTTIKIKGVDTNLIGKKIMNVSYTDNEKTLNSKSFILVNNEMYYSDGNNWIKPETSRPAIGGGFEIHNNKVSIVRDIIDPNDEGEFSNIEGYDPNAIETWKKSHLGEGFSMNTDEAVANDETIGAMYNGEKIKHGILMYVVTADNSDDEINIIPKKDGTFLVESGDKFIDFNKGDVLDNGFTNKEGNIVLESKEGGKEWISPAEKVPLNLILRGPLLAEDIVWGKSDLKFKAGEIKFTITKGVGGFAMGNNLNDEVSMNLKTTKELIGSLLEFLAKNAKGKPSPPLAAQADTVPMPLPFDAVAPVEKTPDTNELRKFKSDMQAMLGRDFGLNDFVWENIEGSDKKELNIVVKGHKIKISQDKHVNGPGLGMGDTMDSVGAIKVYLEGLEEEPENTLKISVDSDGNIYQLLRLEGSAAKIKVNDVLKNENIWNDNGVGFLFINNYLKGGVNSYKVDKTNAENKNFKIKEPLLSKLNIAKSLYEIKINGQNINWKNVGGIKEYRGKLTISPDGETDVYKGVQDNASARVDIPAGLDTTTENLGKLLTIFKE